MHGFIVRMELLRSKFESNSSLPYKCKFDFESANFIFKFDLTSELITIFMSDMFKQIIRKLEPLSSQI